MRIFFIAPGNNPHTEKWVGWFGRKYSGEVFLLSYQETAQKELFPGVEIADETLPLFRIADFVGISHTRLVKELIQKFKPDILHTLWAYGPGIYGARSEFHPHIISPWGSEITLFPYRGGLKSTLQRNLISDALNRADYLMSTSRYLASEIKKLSPKSNSFIFPYGIDTSIFNPDLNLPTPDVISTKISRSDDSIILGMFKGLRKVYGADILLEALTALRKCTFKIQCIVTASGNDEIDFHKKLKKFGLDDIIYPIDRVPHSQMPALLNLIDIFVMPSRSESFGVAALEASAMQKPVVASNVGGIPEVVIDGKTGILVEWGNADELTEMIYKLAINKEMRTLMGEAGRNFVKENYEYNTIMERADKFYEEIISGRVNER